MQLSTTFDSHQLPLFDACIAATPRLMAGLPQASEPATSDVFNELWLRGANDRCLRLLAPILRSLSQNHEQRWLTLVAPPCSITQNWLREAGLNRERILLLLPRHGQSPLQLAQEALRLGRSHTVVSWLQPLPYEHRKALEQAACLGRAQSLNISLG